jgi:hypothetical protein
MITQDEKQEEISPAFEPPTGSGPDSVRPETPLCPIKNIRCDYWTKDGCRVAVCWMDSEDEAAT